MEECTRNLGRYIRRFCRNNGIAKAEFREALGYSRGVDVFQLESMSLNRYFVMCDYMSRNSSLHTEFYMARIKTILQGDYRWER